MNNQKQTAVSVALAVVAAVALGVLLFAPGIGVQGTQVSNAAKQSRNAANSRHQYDALTQFLDAKRKMARNKQVAAQKQTPAAQAANPTARSAFRVGAIVGIWNRFIWTPTASGTAGRLPSSQLSNARAAAKTLARRLDLLRTSSLDAKLPDLAAAATRAKSGLGQLSADLAGPTFTPNAIVDENAKIRQLISIAKSHGLKVMARAPSGAI